MKARSRPYRGGFRTACARNAGIAARRDGWNRNRGGGGQRYGCARCGLRFSEKFGFEWQTLAPDLVVDVLDTYAGGMSIRTIADHISRRIRDGKDARRTVSHRTVHRIITRYAHILGTFEDSLHPHVSEKRVDRRHDDRDGGPQKVPAFHHRRLHPVLESGIVTVHKDTDDVSPMFLGRKGTRPQGSGHTRIGQGRDVPQHGRRRSDQGTTCKRSRYTTAHTRER